MKPDIKEIAYRLYEEYMSEEFEVFDKEMTAGSPVNVGSVYFTVLNKKPVHYLVLRKISDKYYECLKLSSFYEFATHYDIFYHLSLEHQSYIIQTDVNFYLNEDEIKNSVLLEELPEDYFDELQKFVELPEDTKLGYKGILRQGFYYPVGNKWVRAFKEKEIEIVKDYHFRIFEILDEIESTYDNIVNLPPERIENYRLSLVASTEKKTALGKNFVLYKEPEHDFINVIVSPDFLGKKIRVLLKNEKIYEGILEDVVIAIKVEDAKTVDLEKLAKDIKVEEEQ
ncbi:MAG: hypothetical protein ACP5KF_05375 [Sulfurihydrogenibium sp.]